MEYEEREITEIIDGIETTKTELVEVSRTIETIELTGTDGYEIEFNGRVENSYGVDLDYKIENNTASTCFKMQLFMPNGTTPVDFKWGIDHIEIVVLHHDKITS